MPIVDCDISVSSLHVTRRSGSGGVMLLYSFNSEGGTLDAALRTGLTT